LFDKSKINGKADNKQESRASNVKNISYQNITIVRMLNINIENPIERSGMYGKPIPTIIERGGRRRVNNLRNSMISRLS
jgi:hypothetical protein